MIDDIPQRQDNAAGKRVRLRENLLLFVGVPLGWGVFILGFAWVISISEPFSIPAGSMQPTLMRGDLVMAWENYYQSVEPKRGDLVIHRSRDQSLGTVFVVRVVALPGDKIQFVDGVLHIDGIPVEHVPNGNQILAEPGGSSREVPRYMETLPSGRSYRILKERRGSPPDNSLVYEVPPGRYFTLGDNRDNAWDSRYHGPVPAEDILHRPLFIYWSKYPGRIGKWVD